MAIDNKSQTSGPQVYEYRDFDYQEEEEDRQIIVVTFLMTTTFRDSRFTTTISVMTIIANLNLFNNK